MYPDYCRSFNFAITSFIYGNLRAFDHFSPFINTTWLYVFTKTSDVIIALIASSYYCEIQTSLYYCDSVVFILSHDIHYYLIYSHSCAVLQETCYNL